MQRRQPDHQPAAAAGARPEAALCRCAAVRRVAPGPAAAAGPAGAARGAAAQQLADGGGGRPAGGARQRELGDGSVGGGQPGWPLFQQPWQGSDPTGGALASCPAGGLALWPGRQQQQQPPRGLACGRRRGVGTVRHAAGQGKQPGAAAAGVRPLGFQGAAGVCCAAQPGSHCGGAAAAAGGGRQAGTAVGAGRRGSGRAVAACGHHPADCLVSQRTSSRAGHKGRRRPGCCRAPPTPGQPPVTAAAAAAQPPRRGGPRRQRGRAAAIRPAPRHHAAISSMVDLRHWRGSCHPRAGCSGRLGAAQQPLPPASQRPAAAQQQQ